MKVCNTCGKSKTLKDFNKNRGTRDGLQYKCKQCQSDYFKWWTKKNPDKVKERGKQSGRVFRKKNPDYQKDYYKEKSSTEEGREEYRRKARDWYRKNRMS